MACTFVWHIFCSVYLLQRNRNQNPWGRHALIPFWRLAVEIFLVKVYRDLRQGESQNLLSTRAPNQPSPAQPMSCPSYPLVKVQPQPFCCGNSPGALYVCLRRRGSVRLALWPEFWWSLGSAFRCQRMLWQNLRKLCLHVCIAYRIFTFTYMYDYLYLLFGGIYVCVLGGFSLEFTLCLICLWNKIFQAGAASAVQAHSRSVSQSHFQFPCHLAQFMHRYRQSRYFQFDFIFCLWDCLTFLCTFLVYGQKGWQTVAWTGAHQRVSNINNLW